MYMCLVLFVVSKILYSSDLLSCLLEMGVEYYLICIREGLLCGKGVEPPRGRERLSGARESQLFFGVYIITKMFSKILYLRILLSICRAYIYVGLVMASYLLFCCIYFNARCITCCPKREEVLEVYTVIGEVLVLGLLVVVYKIPYSSCM